MKLSIERSPQTRSITVEEFLIQYGDDVDFSRSETSRYELIDGEVFDLEP
jgi:hypothetical protein